MVAEEEVVVGLGPPELEDKVERQKEKKKKERTSLRVVKLNDSPAVKIKIAIQTDPFYPISGARARKMG